MRHRWFAVVLALAGCNRVESFVCEVDGDCVDGSRQGSCEASGFCSFPDDGCQGGKRYGTWAGDGLAGTCVTSEECAPACGACEECVGGSCQLMAGCEVPCEPACNGCQVCIGGVCEASAEVTCEVECGDFVYGPADANNPSSCLAYASGKGAGMCTPAGECVWAEGTCQGPGAEIVGCDAQCTRPDHNCAPGTPASEVTAATMCATNVETATCASVCTDNPGKLSTLLPQKCDASGRCVAEAETECGLYACAGPSACLMSCMNMGDCAKGNCNMMTGLCE